MKKQHANWSPMATYNKHRVRPANGGDYIGIGCGNIAFAIIYGLTYVGDCIKDMSNKQESKVNECGT